MFGFGILDTQSDEGRVNVRVHVGVKPNSYRVTVIGFGEGVESLNTHIDLKDIEETLYEFKLVCRALAALGCTPLDNVMQLANYTGAFEQAIADAFNMD